MIFWYITKKYISDETKDVSFREFDIKFFTNNGIVIIFNIQVYVKVHSKENEILVANEYNGVLEIGVLAMRIASYGKLGDSNKEILCI